MATQKCVAYELYNYDNMEQQQANLRAFHSPSLGTDRQQDPTFKDDASTDPNSRV